MTDEQKRDVAQPPAQETEEIHIDEPTPVLVETATGFDLPDAPHEVPAGQEPLAPTELIRLPARHNPRLQRLLQQVNADEDLHAIWRCQNVTAVDRLGMSDHGPVHMHIVANSALRLLRLLLARDLVPSIVKDHGLEVADAEIVVVLGALLHDTGMSIHRANHEEMSLFVALPKLQELLADLYPPAMRRVVISEVLHAIITHRSDGRPLTLEAGVVRLADALDMAQGRARVPFEAGQVNIHSVSAAAIDSVQIGPGETKPIRVVIRMNNSAGIFQLDDLLKDKLRGSGLEPYVEVAAEIEGTQEKRLVQAFHI
jgi:metal-dependent HD superfamily phosphatase/phosphodiesterase